MWTELFALVIMGASAAFVIKPLFSRSTNADGAGSLEQSLEDQKLELYGALRDLEYDRQMGKIADADYKELHESLTDEALTLLEQMDGHRSIAEVKQDPLEQEITRYRARRDPKPNSEVRCPRCGQVVPGGFRFCGECGAAVDGEHRKS